MLRATLLTIMLIGALAPLTGAQGACVSLATWATDPSGDSTVMVEGEEVPGSLDILAVRVGEAGDACDWVTIGVEIDDSDLKQLAEDAAEQALIPGTGEMVARVVVDPLEIAGAPEDHSFEFYWAFDVDLSGSLPPEAQATPDGAWVVHLVDGSPVASTETGPQSALTHSHSGGILDASFAKSAVTVHGWEGFEATTMEDNELTGILQDMEFSGGRDQASSSIAYTIGKGLGNLVADLDADGLLDHWEKAQFGDLSAGPDDDPDSDGYSNAEEMEAATDPNDAASVPPPPGSASPQQPPAQQPPVTPVLGEDGSGNDASGSGSSGSDGDESKGSPGFGLTAAVVAVLGAVLALRRRNTH